MFDGVHCSWWFKTCKNTLMEHDRFLHARRHQNVDFVYMSAVNAIWCQFMNVTSGAIFPLSFKWSSRGKCHPSCDDTCFSFTSNIFKACHDSTWKSRQVWNRTSQCRFSCQTVTSKMLFMQHFWIFIPPNCIFYTRCHTHGSRASWTWFADLVSSDPGYSTWTHPSQWDFVPSGRLEWLYKRRWSASCHQPFAPGQTTVATSFLNPSSPTCNSDGPVSALLSPTLQTTVSDSNCEFGLPISAT